MRQEIKKLNNFRDMNKKKEKREKGGCIAFERGFRRFLKNKLIKK